MLLFALRKRVDSQFSLNSFLVLRDYYLRWGPTKATPILLCEFMAGY